MTSGCSLSSFSVVTGVGVPRVTSPAARVVRLAASEVGSLPAGRGIAVLIVVPGGPPSRLLNCPIKGLRAQKLLSGLLACVRHLSMGADLTAFGIFSPFGFLDTRFQLLSLLTAPALSFFLVLLVPSR